MFVFMLCVIYAAFISLGLPDGLLGSAWPVMYQELQVPVFLNGELVYELPTLEQIRTYCAQQVDTLWDEIKRFDNPQTYYVDLSQKLWDIKYGLLKSNAK